MVAERESDQLAGVVLGGAYRLVGRIGEGGMGAVYEAHHLRLRKRVAVKLMNRALASNEEALARFHREASVASHLGHPNLVNIIDFGKSEEGEPYLVMEYLDGEDLDRRIRRAGSISLQSAVQITRQVASALAVVHAKGIVHRDLKPANVFLVQVPGEPDFIKVLDFGVSKIKAARTKLTRASTMVGTPEYMSPEQASGLVDEIDHRADQWALACIAWEMLSGRAPFTADDANALFYQVINLPPQSLSKQVSDLPPGVEPVLLRALSKRPADRYPSIKEFARAFATVALGKWAEMTPAPVDPSAVAAMRELALASEMRPALAETMAATGESGIDVAADRTREVPFGFRLRLPIAVWGAAIVFATAGVLFVTMRSRSTSAGAMVQASTGGTPVATSLPLARPVVQTAMAGLPVVDRLPSARSAPGESGPSGPTSPTKLAPPPNPGKSKTAKSGTTTAVGANPGSGAATTKKLNPFVSPFESEPQRSKSREEDATRDNVASPHQRRKIIEEL